VSEWTGTVSVGDIMSAGVSSTLRLEPESYQVSFGPFRTSRALIGTNLYLLRLRAVLYRPPNLLSFSPTGPPPDDSEDGEFIEVASPSSAGAAFLHFRYLFTTPTEKARFPSFFSCNSLITGAFRRKYCFFPPVSPNTRGLSFGRVCRPRTPALPRPAHGVLSGRTDAPPF